MIHRNKGDTHNLSKSVLIPNEEVEPIKDSLIEILKMVSIENSDKVQREHIKNIYKLLNYF